MQLFHSMSFLPLATPRCCSNNHWMFSDPIPEEKIALQHGQGSQIVG